jgi:hypothetical protein
MTNVSLGLPGNITDYDSDSLGYLRRGFFPFQLGACRGRTICFHNREKSREMGQGALSG